MVVTADSNQEQDDLYVVEDVNPLLTFRSLAANVEHAICQVAQLEDGLGDARGSQSRAEDILVGRKVVFGKEPFDVGEETESD